MPRTSRRLFVLVTALAMVVTTTVAVAAPSAVAAASFTVDATDDVVDADPGDGVCATGGGTCTLRAAVQEANALGSADIALPAGSFSLTVTDDDQTDGSDTAADGDLDITGAVTITGQGSGQTTVVTHLGYLNRFDDPRTERVFDIGPAATVTLEGLELTGGDEDAPGGAVDNAGELTVIDVSFVGNKATMGGAINNREYNGVASLTVSASRFDSNIASEPTGQTTGGAIRTADTDTVLRVTDSVFIGNRSIDGSSNMGDAIGTRHSESATVELIDSVIQGGGSSSAVLAGTIIAIRTTVSGNAGTALDAYERIQVTDSTLKNNGRGLYLHGVNGAATGTVDGSTISGNSNDFRGGGIRVYDADLSVTNSTVSGNSAADGGGIYLQGGYRAGTVTLDSVTLSGNTASPGVGNGLWAGLAGGGDAPAVTLTNTILSDTAAGDDCHVQDGATLTSTGHNLDSDDTCGLTATGDLPATDPQLGALADNGGPTLTHAPAPSGPAVDGGATTLAVDQRGEPRPAGSADDIGAVEYAATFPSVAWDTAPDSIHQAHHTPAEVTVSATNPDSAADIDDARLRITVDAVDAFTDGAHITATETDSGQTIPWTIDGGDLVGWWEPAGPFLLPAGTTDTTTFEVDVADAAPVGTYDLTLELVDVSQDTTVASAQDSIEVEEPNVAPILDIVGGPYEVAEGGTVQIDASNSYDPDGTIEVRQWKLDKDLTWGETGYAASRGDEVGPTPLFDATSADGPEDYVLHLRAYDDDGTGSLDKAYLTVTNVAPAVDAGADLTTETGGEIAVAATFTDPGVDDTHTAEVDWGDGDTATFDGALDGNIDAIHSYAAAGSYTVTVDVTDDDGDTGTDAFEVTVRDPAPAPGPGPSNAAPVAADVAADTTQGEPVTIDVLANDEDPDGDALTIVGVDQPDGGTVTIDGDTVVYVPGDDLIGEDTFTYTVSDGRGATASATVTVTVTASAEEQPLLAPCDDAEDGFPDDEGSVHAGALDCLAALGLMKGHTDGDVRPHEPVLRGQAAGILLPLIQYVSHQAVDELCGEPDARFTDVPSDSVFADAIRCLATTGVIAGYPNNTFQPGDAVTRGQAASLLWRTTATLGYTLPDGDSAPFDDVPADGSHADAVASLHTAGVLEGFADGSYRPDVTLTRGQLASAVQRLLAWMEDQDVAA